MHDAVLARRAKARAPVSAVVCVRARQERGVSTLSRECGQRVIQLGLAVVAAIPIVAAVALTPKLIGRDRLVCDPDRSGDSARAVELTFGEGGRDRRYGKG